MKTTEIVIAEQKVMEYVAGLTPLQVKKVLFALTLLKGNERLNESPIAELRVIANMYDAIIDSKFAKELATRIAESYSKSYPKTFLAKKEIAAYSDARYRKLYDAVGLFGFDYIISTLRNTKAYIATPNSGVDEMQMLKAMRWDERREDMDPFLSNQFHRKKGLEYAGFGEMSEYLVKDSFIIANVYEMVQSAGKYEGYAPSKSCKKEMPVRDMKIHFIKEAEQITAFYEAEAPKLPNGYNEEELIEGGHIHKFAERGLLLNSKEVLAYFKAMEEYNSIISSMEAEFDVAEFEFISENPDTVKSLIANEW